MKTHGLHTETSMITSYDKEGRPQSGLSFKLLHTMAPYDQFDHRKGWGLPVCNRPCTAKPGQTVDEVQDELCRREGITDTPETNCDDGLTGIEFWADREKYMDSLVVPNGQKYLKDEAKWNQYFCDYNHLLSFGDVHG